MRAFLIALASLMFCQAAVAQNVNGRVEWYGIYTVSKSQEIDDPTSPTGKRFVSTPERPSSNTDQIPGTDGIRFGYSYVLSGRAGTNVQVKHVYRFPPPGMPDAVAGGIRTTYEHVRQSRVGDSVLIGWSFAGAPEERILKGVWALEVWQGGRKLTEKKFTIY